MYETETEKMDGGEYSHLLPFVFGEGKGDPRVAVLLVAEASSAETQK